MHSSDLISEVHIEVFVYYQICSCFFYCSLLRLIVNLKILNTLSYLLLFRDKLKKGGTSGANQIYAGGSVPMAPPLA